MKSKLLLILIFVSLFGFSQTVPNTTTFTLQNVVDAVNPTTDDLVDCFADAISAYFNPLYSGSKNSLLNFRDYGPHNGVTCPAFASAGSLIYLTNTNSLTLTYPAVNAGDFIIVVAGHYSSSDLAVAGFQILGSSLTFSSKRHTLFYKHFTVNDAGGTIYLTSPDYATKFATVYKVTANTTNNIQIAGGIFTYTANTYTPPAIVSGDACDMGFTVFSLFISQQIIISPGAGWTIQANNWRSAIGASCLLTYNFTTTENAPSNTFTFIGEVPISYFSFEIY